MRATFFHRKFLLMVALVSLSFALDDTSARLKSVSQKLFCNCGCGEVLAECSHLECKNKTTLKQEDSFVRHALEYRER